MTNRNGKNAAAAMLEIVKDFERDTNEKKLNLVLGVCMDDDKNIYKFKVIDKVSKMLINSGNLSHGYTTLTGLPGLAPLASKLIFGEDEKLLNKVVAFQTYGAAGALSLGGSLLFRHFKKNKIYIPAQTWEQHIGIFQNAGFEIQRYRYYDPIKQKIDFDGLIEDLQNAENDSVILLHATCHNPSGGILSHDQWNKIICIIKENNLFPFFDIAYHGLGKDLIEDTWSIRTFAEAGLEFLTAQTFSKNFALYGERVGFIFGVMNDSNTRNKVMNVLEYDSSNSYLMTPAFGPKLVYEILKDPELFTEWKKELGDYNNRLVQIRAAVKSNLDRKVEGKDFSFLVDNEGLFAWFNFTGNEGEILREKYSVYVLPNGRVNVSGLSLSDVDYFTDAMAAVL